MALNPEIELEAVTCPMTHSNALDLVRGCDLAVDATDNSRTWYVLNDACVLAGRTLVSESTMGAEGQLTVYNHPLLPFQPL